MGKPKHSHDTRGEQKGAQQHAEGQQGPKAREAFLAGISDHSRRDADGDTGRAANDPRARGSDAEMHDAKIANPALERDGGHRLFENRTQHDEAEKNSEKNRRDIDMKKHGHDHDQFQGRGGHTGHPEVTPQPEGGVTSVKSTGQGGGNRADEDRGRH